MPRECAGMRRRAGPAGSRKDGAGIWNPGTAESRASPVAGEEGAPARRGWRSGLLGSRSRGLGHLDPHTRKAGRPKPMSPEEVRAGRWIGQFEVTVAEKLAKWLSEGTWRQDALVLRVQKF